MPERGNSIFDLLLLILIFALFCSAPYLYGQWMSARRRNHLEKWAASKGLTFSPEKDRSMESLCPDLVELQRGSDRYACNIMKGKCSGRPFLAFDYHYTYKQGRSYGHHHFSVVAVPCGLPLKPLFITSEDLSSRISTAAGSEDINFESAEFSRRFFVKAEDRRWAYDVLHARTMEFLLEQNPRFQIQLGGRHVYAWRTTGFRPADFECAIETACGILDRLPEYLVEKLRDNPS